MWDRGGNARKKMQGEESWRREQQNNATDNATPVLLWHTAKPIKPRMFDCLYIYVFIYLFSIMSMTKYVSK